MPPALDAVIARGMAKNVDERYPTAGQLAAAAQEALRAEPLRAVASGPATVAVPANPHWVVFAKDEERRRDPAQRDPLGGRPLPLHSPTSIAVLPGGHQAYITSENDGTIPVLKLPK